MIYSPGATPSPGALRVGMLSVPRTAASEEEPNR
jgi:hypothetical protein